MKAIVLVLLGLFLFANFSVSAASKSLSVNDFFTCPSDDSAPVSASSVLEWLQKPAAVRFVGTYDRTYVSWIKSDGKIQIRYYDHRKNKWSGIVTVDDLLPDFGIEAKDDHNAPSLLILPDGQLLLFYTVHDTQDSFFVRTSTSAEDISSWGTRNNIYDENSNTYYNYPQAKKLANGNIALFYRKGSYLDADEYFKISSDNGQTWSQPTKLIDFKEGGIYAFVYAKGTQIHVAWDKTETIPSKTNVYYMYSPDGGITWKRRNGRNLQLPVREKGADFVFGTTNDPEYVWDIVVDDDYNPFIVFSYKEEPNHEFRFAKWDGAFWITSAITSSSLLYDSGHFFSGGIVIDPDDVYKVYLSKKRFHLELETWASSDEGKTWKKTEEITGNSAVDNFRPQIVENHSDDLRLVWSSGFFDGLINKQWAGFTRSNIQSEITKNSIPKNDCLGGIIRSKADMILRRLLSAGQDFLDIIER